jgi:FkbM family methyltransferase
MPNFASQLVNRAIRPLGLELRRTKPGDPFAVQSQLVTKPDPTVFDIGAAVGDVSAQYLGLFPAGRIHAFEPFPEFFQKLEVRFKTDPRCKLNQAAISDATGSVCLTSNRSAFTNSIWKTDPLATESWGEGVLDTQSTVQVPATTIDRYCQANGIETIDVLKLDIQGGELKALQGAKSLLAAGKVALIYMEVLHAPTYLGQPYFEDYLRFFRELGYVLLNIYNPVTKLGKLLQCDVIFVPGPIRDAS